MLGLILHLSGRAWACSCVISPIPTTQPPNGSVDVPLNVQPLVRAEIADESIRLLEPGGAVVPATHVSHPGSSPAMIELIPATPLAPHTHYTLAVGDRLASFTTGSWTDLAAPAGRGLIGWRWNGPMVKPEDPSQVYIEYLGRCSDNGVVLEFEPPRDESSATWQVQATAGSDFSQAQTITFLPAETPVVGSPVCGPSNFAPIAPGDPIQLRFRARDQAGGLTTWSEPIRLIPGVPPTSWFADAPPLGDAIMGAILAMLVSLTAVVWTVLVGSSARSRRLRRSIKRGASSGDATRRRTSSGETTPTME